jgi:hypothetical protein
VALSREPFEQPVQGKTLNINSEGFYCIVDQPFPPGVVLDCVLNVASEGMLDDPEDYNVGRMKLKCTVEVVRVEPVGSRFGVACHIKSFTVTRRE